jgi:hypothetical protein
VLADRADQKLEVVELGDQQIQPFPSSWQADIPADKSVEHLVRNLTSRKLHKHLNTRIF